jgi:predicted transporter
LFWDRVGNAKGGVLMAYKSLILGIFFSMGIFAIKSGIGLSYYLLQTVSNRARAGAYLLYACSYLVIFFASHVILKNMDLTQHLSAVQDLLQSGMLIHLTLAGMMILWGMVLLKRNTSTHQKSMGWLLLAAPCPVCATVILFSVGFLMTCFPDFSMAVTLMLYTAFIVINLLAVFIAVFWKVHSNGSAETLLGGAMLLIAAYFLLSVTIMPQFADVDKIYRLAMHHSGSKIEQSRELFVFLICISGLFLGGFGVMTLKTRRTR